MILLSLAGFLIAGAAAQSAGIDTIQSVLTTQVFSGVGSFGPVTVVLTIKPMTSSACGGTYNPAMGMIGHQCYETEVDPQPGTRPYVITSLIRTSSLPSGPVNPPASATVFTTLVSSCITTKTLAPQTITKTVSEVAPTSTLVAPSMTVTAMCQWAEENIITPCTTIVLATAGTTPLLTSSKSAAIPPAHNPLKSVTVFLKRAADNTVTFLKGLNGFVFAGGNHGTNEATGEITHAIQRRDVRDCIIPPLYTPVIMSIFSILGGIALFFYFDVRQPRRAGFSTAAYIVFFITIYLVIIYIEYYRISIAPAWKYCIGSTEQFEAIIANLTASAAAAEAKGCKAHLL